MKLTELQRNLLEVAEFTVKSIRTTHRGNFLETTHLIKEKIKQSEYLFNRR